MHLKIYGERQSRSIIIYGSIEDGDMEGLIGLVEVEGK
jgi:hypothetical protein